MPPGYTQGFNIFKGCVLLATVYSRVYRYCSATTLRTPEEVFLNVGTTGIGTASHLN